jgi:prepilin-type N-terminal cleavage/methylation domain-containing protein
MRKGRHDRGKRGFTLIELLIVIAIIAILALIAIPNFLEAQIRSRVAAVQADMRSLATAIETYTVDYGRPIPSYQEWVRTGPQGQNGGLPEINWWFTQSWVNYGTGYGTMWSMLTTPIAYTAKIYKDPFQWDNESQNWKEYWWHVYPPRWMDNSGAHVAAHNRGYRWSLGSIGPSKIGDNENGWLYEGTTVTVTILAALNAEWPSWPAILYDPTNGTRSVGYIVRTNKGDLKG